MDEKGRKRKKGSKEGEAVEGEGESVNESDDVNE